MYTSQVRRMLGQVIIAMAHHHYLSLEGGHLMVEFVVRQCALNLEDKVSWHLMLHTLPCGLASSQYIKGPLALVHVLYREEYTRVWSRGLMPTWLHCISVSI